MKNSFGTNVALTVFGESHGMSVGVVLDGLAPGIKVDCNFIRKQLDHRRSVGNISTPRREKDEFTIQSGVFNGTTTGTPICIVIPNEDTKSKDYSELRGKARPGHADYTSYCKYHGFEDYRGGGHFSGRVTAGIVAAGAIAITALNTKGIHIGTHLKKCAGVVDRQFHDIEKEIELLNSKEFAVLDSDAGEEMVRRILAAKEAGDSVGGVLETVVSGLPSGVGEPWFDSLESVLSHALFSIPGIKGVEFGDGFTIADKMGSEANDPMTFCDGVVTTQTNTNGGINGGISNGMPVIIRCAVKPTPSIFKTQNTVDFINKHNTEISLAGRHDPCIAHRARVVVDSLVAITLYDILSGRFGTDYFGGN